MTSHGQYARRAPGTGIVCAMLSTFVLALAATAEKAEESTNAPYIIGGLTLAILIISLLLVVFAIGGGREHS